METHQAHAFKSSSSSYELVGELGLVVAVVDLLVRIAREETHGQGVDPCCGGYGGKTELWPRAGEKRERVLP